MHIGMVANARSVHTQRWARAYAERGHRVDVLSIREQPIPGARCHRIAVGPVDSRSRGWTALSYLRLGLTLGRHLRELRPDVVQACYATTHGALAAFAGRHPWLLSVWGSDVAGAADAGWARRAWTRRAVAGADAVCATSRFLAREVERLCPVPVAVTPFGVDVERFRRPPGARSRSARRDELVVGYVKTLAPRYGPGVLVEALARLAAEQVPVRLVMIGRDETGGAVARQAARLGVADRVSFAGFVPHEELPARLAGLDVVVNPSTCQEAFGVSILEASACSLPVVATAVGGVREVCLDGRTGLLVPPGDPQALAGALLTLANDPATARAMGEAGRRFVVETYRWEDCVRRMLAELERVRRAAVRG